MSHFCNLCNQHKKQKVSEIEENLFVVTYPWVTLIFSIKFLIAFKDTIGWHMAIGYPSAPFIKRHKKLIQGVFEISKYYQTRSELITEAKKRIDREVKIE